MEDKLPELDSLKINKRSGWPAIITGIIGALFGFLILLRFESIAFSAINVFIVGGGIGILYGRICKKDFGVVFLGGTIGSLCALNAISFGIFIFGGIFISLCLRDIDSYDYHSGTAGWIALVGWLILLIMIFSTSSGGVGNWIFFILLLIIGGFIIWMVITFPFLNILSALIIGGVLGWFLGYRNNYYPPSFFARPIFLVPLFSFTGYFIGCKITEGRKPKKKKIAKGGLIMAEDPVFPKDIDKDISPVAFSEKAIIHDLLSALNNKSLLLTRIESWGARARGQDQIRAFEMIRETLMRETDIIKAYTANQQARLDFENLKEFNQYLQKERIKAQLTEEKYRQAELEEKIKRIKLEGEYNSLTLQRRIKGLKKDQEMTEDRIERLEKEQLEKVGFQEEIRKVKTRKLADRVEYLYNRKKEIRKKYPPKEAEEIIDELDRAMIEEGLKEE